MAGQRGDRTAYISPTSPRHLHCTSRTPRPYLPHISQAVEATSAAPAIFPAARIGGDLLVDGGMVANDPTLLALREAHALWPNPNPNPNPNPYPHP